MSHYWVVDPHDRTFEMRKRGKRRYRLVARYEGDATAHTTLFPELIIGLGQVQV